MTDFVYTDEEPLDTDHFVDLLRRSGLAERRPVDERSRIASMVLNADIMMTAWDDGRLIGVARSVTDFAYCCYLSDLAVDATYAGQGVGKGLIDATLQRLADGCRLILLSAPAAEGYYTKQGFEQHESAWYRFAGAR